MMVMVRLLLLHLASLYLHFWVLSATPLSPAGAAAAIGLTAVGNATVNAKRTQKFEFSDHGYNFRGGYLVDDDPSTQSRHVEVAIAFTLLDAKIRRLFPDETTPILDDISFADTGTNFRLRPHTFKDKTPWTRKSLHETLEVLVEHFLPLQTNVESLSMKVDSRIEGQEPNSFNLWITETNADIETIHSGEYEFRFELDTDKPLSNVGAENTIDLWEAKYHRHWGNEWLRTTKESFRGKAGVVLQYEVMDPQSFPFKVRYGDLEKILKDLTTYMRTKRDDKWCQLEGIAFRKTRAYTAAVFRIDFVNEGAANAAIVNETAKM